MHGKTDETSLRGAVPFTRVSQFRYSNGTFSTSWNFPTDTLRESTGTAKEIFMK